MLTQAYPYAFAGRPLPCLVGGELVSHGRTFENISPVNGALLATVTEADAALVDRAVRAARAALRGPWGRLSMAERCNLLRKVAERIEQRCDEFVSAESADTGTTLAQARSLDIPRGAANVERARLRERLAGVGKTLAQARSLDIPRGAANFRAYADLATA